MRRRRKALRLISKESGVVMSNYIIVVCRFVDACMRVFERFWSR